MTTTDPTIYIHPDLVLRLAERLGGRVGAHASRPGWEGHYVIVGGAPPVLCVERPDYDCDDDALDGAVEEWQDATDAVETDDGEGW